MNWESGQESVTLTGTQDGLGERVVFDGADDGMAEDEASEESAAVASAEMDGSHGVVFQRSMSSSWVLLR